MKTTFKSADLIMSIFSNVRRCWLARPPVAGFLEMFAGVPYNREKNESLNCTPRIYLSVSDPPPNLSHLDFVIRYIDMWRTE